MNRRTVLLAGCGGERLRYKLALSVDTHDGIKTGFSVVEVVASDVSVPARVPPGTSSAQWDAIRANRLTWSDGKPDFQHLVARAGGKPTKTGLIDDMAQCTPFPSSLNPNLRLRGPCAPDPSIGELKANLCVRLPRTAHELRLQDGQYTFSIGSHPAG